MVKYRIEWNRIAAKELKKIDTVKLPKIISTVENLAENPFPMGNRKLKGSKYTYRIRIGDYRVIYEVDNQSRRIMIMRVRHRKDAYY